MLNIENLSVEIKGRLLVGPCSLLIPAGTITAMVGESGGGKSTLAAAFLGMLPNESRVKGRIILRNQDLLTCSANQIAAIRKSVVFTVFQDALSSFNPSVKMKRQLYEFAGRRKGDSVKCFNEKMSSILLDIGLSPKLMARYPFELSGGMLQRCMLACAFYIEPELLIADEPTSAVDVLTQLDVLNLLRRLNAEQGTTIWLITHDLELTMSLADRIAVMRKGQVIEQGMTAEVLASPKHEYTRQLLDSRF